MSDPVSLGIANLYASMKAPETETKPDPVLGAASPAEVVTQAELEGNLTADARRMYKNSPKMFDKPVSGRLETPEEKAGKLLYPGMVPKADPTAPGKEAKAAAAAPPTAALKAPAGFDDAFVKAVAKTVPNATQAHVELYAAEARLAQAQVDGWEKEARSDPEIGGENLPAVVDDARRLISDYGSPELLQLLNDSGLGSHKALLKFAAKVARAVREGRE